MIVTSLFNSNPITFTETEIQEVPAYLLTQEEDAEYDRADMEANKHEALEKYYKAKTEELQAILAEQEAQRLAEEEAQRQAEAEAQAQAEAEAQSYYDYTYDASAYSLSEYEAKEWIAMHESGGDYYAVSPSGTYIGRYQLTASYLNGDYSPENQEAVANAYVAERYGSWQAAQQFWQCNGFY